MSTGQTIDVVNDAVMTYALFLNNVLLTECLSNVTPQRPEMGTHSTAWEITVSASTDFGCSRAADAASRAAFPSHVACLANSLEYTRAETELLEGTDLLSGKVNTVFSILIGIGELSVRRINGTVQLVTAHHLKRSRVFVSSSNYPKTASLRIWKIPHANTLCGYLRCLVIRVYLVPDRGKRPQSDNRVAAVVCITSPGASARKLLRFVQPAFPVPCLRSPQAGAEAQLFP